MREKPSRVLLRIATPDGLVRTTQEELGRIAGMIRSTLGRKVKDLVATGMVEMDFPSVQSNDPVALKAAGEVG